MGWLLALGLLVLGVPAAAWLAQDHLVFLPRLAGPPAELPRHAIRLELATADGPRLRGWFLAPRAAPGVAVPAPTIVYFGGNAEDVSWAIADPRWPAHWGLAAFNYRGYGASEGRPGERALVADAIAIHDAIAGRADVDRGRIVAFGRSLGSGVAVALAGQRPLSGVILASPYDSLVALGRHHYPMLPVALLLRHRFDSAPIAARSSAPLLAIVASSDAVIPAERSRALYEAWAGPKRWLALERTDHNTLSQPDAFWTAVADFLEPIAGR